MASKRQPYRDSRETGRVVWESYVASPSQLRLPGFGSLSVAYKEKPRFYRFPPHSHRIYEFYYVDKGSILFDLAGRRQSLRQCQGVLFLPGQRHSFSSGLGPPPNILNIHFSSPGLLRLLPGLKALSGRPLPLDAAALALVNDLCRAAKQAVGGKPAFAARQASAMLAALLLRLPGLSAPGPTRRRAAALGAVELKSEVERFVGAHLREKLGLPEIAQALRLSVSALAHGLKRSSGESPHQLVLRLRLSRAKELLRTPGASVKETALLTGFSTPSALVRRFRMSEGMTPGTYRRTLTEQP